MAANEFFLPDEDDARVLRILIDREKKRAQGKGVPFEQDHVPTAPEVYIALVPDGGIDGVEIKPGTGTGTGSGTGSNPLPGDGDTVSSAMCSIYELRNLELEDDVAEGSATGRKELVYLGFSEEVHNLAASSIPAGYAIIQRDMFGRFVTGAQPSSKRYKAVIIQTGGIAPGEHGEVQIYQGGLPVEGWTEDAYLDWLYTSTGLPAGQKVIIQYYADEEHYTIEIPWCS